MAKDCTNPENQGISGAVPGNNNPGIGLNINNDALAKNNIFNPNKLLAAAQTYKTLNNVANKMFGIEARWFRAVPQQRSKDVIFQEYTLSQVEEEPICLNVLIPTGQSIESKYNFDLMGLEYELPFEVQLDKTYWEEMAGFGTAPQKKDIVYLPMPNKLFQVESSYLKRGFMEQETHWVVNLRKYQPEASRKESESLLETIDQYTVSEEELFGDLINKDVEKLTDDKQMSPLSSTTEDKYKELNKELKIVNHQLKIGGITVAESMYDLSTSDSNPSVTYKNSKDTIPVEYDRSIMAWLNKKKVSNQKTYMVTKIESDNSITYPANYKVYIKGNIKFETGDILTVFRTNNILFYGEIIDDTDAINGIYYIKIDDEVLSYLNNISSTWSGTKGWRTYIDTPINILTGTGENDNNLSLNLYSNKFVKVNYSSSEYIFPLDENIKNGDWYGIVANIGSSWGQLNISLWIPSSNEQSSDLINIYNKTVTFEPIALEIENYVINKSESYLTNIRLFNQTIEVEKQSNELLSYFSENADFGLILDNCDPKLGLPYVSKQR